MEAVNSPITFSIERMLIFKKVIEYAETETQNFGYNSLPEIEVFKLQQDVMLSVTSFDETKWIGPVKIVQTLPHKIRVKFDNAEVRWIKDMKSLCP